MNSEFSIWPSCERITIFLDRRARTLHSFCVSGAGFEWCGSAPSGTRNICEVHTLVLALYQKDTWAATRWVMELSRSSPATRYSHPRAEPSSSWSQQSARSARFILPCFLASVLVMQTLNILIIVDELSDDKRRDTAGTRRRCFSLRTSRSRLRKL